MNILKIGWIYLFSHGIFFYSTAMCILNIYLIWFWFDLVIYLVSNYWMPKHPFKIRDYIVMLLFVIYKCLSFFLNVFWGFFVLKIPKVLLALASCNEGIFNTPKYFNFLLSIFFLLRHWLDFWTKLCLKKNFFRTFKS